MLRLVTVMLVALLAVPPVLAQEKPASAIKLSLPNITWHLEIPAMGFAVQRDTTRPDGHGRSLYAADKARGLNLSVFLERVRTASARECREFYWQRLRNSPAKREGVRMSERGEMAILEYTVKAFGPQLPLPEDVKKLLGSFEQRHLHAYLARGGVCSDIHLSKVVKPGQEAPPFGSIVDRVHLIDAVRAWIGLTLANFETDVWTEFNLLRPSGSGQPPTTGAQISKLDDDGLAYVAGLRAGDRILKLNGESVRTAGEFLRKIGSFAPDTTVSLTFVRGNIEQMLAVKLSAAPK
jgi:hypothetical protein